MTNKKNSRTQLIWRAVFNPFFQEKFPAWAKFFDSPTKQPGSPPILKIVKTTSPDNYRISFEETICSSDVLELNKVYSREELKERFKITDATINNGIFKPKDFSSVWLFVTEEKTPDQTQYKDYFDGQKFTFQGHTTKRTDHLIFNHDADGNELLVFYRKKKNEFPNYGFLYLGKFSYYSHTTSDSEQVPTRFILYPLEVSLDE